VVHRCKLAIDHLIYARPVRRPYPGQPIEHHFAPSRLGVEDAERPLIGLNAGVPHAANLMGLEQLDVAIEPSREVAALSSPLKLPATPLRRDHSEVVPETPPPRSDVLQLRADRVPPQRLVA